MMTDFAEGSEALISKLCNEVRHTLHHVMGLIELVAEEPLADKQARRLSQCRTSADQLLRIANDVTELAAPFRPAGVGEPFALAAMVEEVAEVMGLLASWKGLLFRCSVDPSVPAYVIADREAIQDMLRRTLDNSIRVTSYGNVTLSVKAREVTEDSATVMFEIFDTGPGIPKDPLDALESDASLSPLRGLGLPIVRRRALAMQGEFTCVSSTSRGTTLRIALPMLLGSKAVASNGAAPDAAAPEKAAPLRLLVAEDSDDSFALFKAYVKEEGHQIARALNGAEAVKMAQSGSYDLIVMDVGMPVMDGYTATRSIREWETEQRRPRLPIVLLSAEDSSRQMRVGASVGCSGYLTKPTPKRQVLQALRFYGAQSPAAHPAPALEGS